MKRIFISVFTLFLFCVNPPNGQSAIDPRLFDTKAEFSVEDDVKSLLSAVATLEAHPMYGSDHSWLKIHFYSFPFTTEEIQGALNGDLKLIEARRYEEDYNSQAIIILSMDKESRTVWQVDMAVPGHTCTIAPSEKEVQNFLQEFQFDGKQLKLKSNGSYTCGILFENVTDRIYNWNFDVDIEVFEKK